MPAMRQPLGCHAARAVLIALSGLGTSGAGAPAVVPFGDRGEIHVCSDAIVRVTHRPTSAPVQKASLIARADWPSVRFNVSQHGGVTVVETSRLRVEASASPAGGRVAFIDRSDGRLVLAEAGNSFTPSKDLGRDTYQVEQSWQGAAAEALYGGGSYQNGLLNYKSAPLEMIQFNTEAVVPYFASTEGYGLLWDNYAWTFLNPPKKALVAAGAAGNGSVSFVPEEDGDHFFFVGRGFPKPGATPSWGGGGSKEVHVFVADPDGHETAVLSWDALANMPASLTGRAPGLKRGTRYTVRYSWNAPGVGLYVQGPEYKQTTLRSFLGDLVDYYFVLAPSPDAAIAGYRELTGAAPLYGRWAYGFWQCKEHYDTQDHLLSAAREFRSRGLPVDAIVQDWLYWGDLGWGPHWSPKTYPDPAAMLKEVHSLNMRFMVSVWSKFDAKTPFYEQMGDKGWLLGKSNYYDAWNPDARHLFYNFSKAAHFSIGVDSLWLDATEPENYPNVNAKSFLGSGNAYMNSYSLKTTQAISDGLRADYPDAQGARVFSLTRSSFAGQQRTGAALWSGDITGSWDSLRRQIAASINYQLSGMPYWSEDIGGFFRPKDQYTSPAYHDLLIRWFQFGAFTPIFRVHGAGTRTELWNFGDAVMQTINASAIALRYRLLPYTYSGFARVEMEGYTMQRGLVMDFPKDKQTWGIADEFMWGDALLVTPFHSPADSSSLSTTRSAYIPQAAGWVNFHTGKPQPPGNVQVSFRINEAPVFVRAGSIVALGPYRQHVEDGPDDPLEIRVYPGGDAEFRLYEDDGKSGAYKAGQASVINMAWRDAASELVIGGRRGAFPGMLAQRTFHVVRVAPGHGVGVAPAAPDHTVRYTGDAVTVKLGGSQVAYV